MANLPPELGVTPTGEVIPEIGGMAQAIIPATLNADGRAVVVCK